MLFLLVELPASLCVQKHKNDDEISGDGQAAFKELCNTYGKVTDEVIRATMEELVNTPMEPGQNPDDYFNQKRLLRIRAEKMGEHISDRYFKDICVTGFTDNYKDVKMMMYRDPSFDVDQMQTTMRHMFLDEQSRNGTKGRIAGRGSVMTAVTSEQDIICYWCKNRGHSKKDCPEFKSRTKPAGAAKWCSVHRTTTHHNEECYSQGATRPTKNASASLACTNCRHCTSADSKEPTVDNTDPSHSDKPVINFAGSSDDFDGGFMYAAGMPGRFIPSAKGATLLVDSGASGSFLDDELIPDLKTRMREFKTLSTPREITTAGKHTLHGIGTGIISFTIRDNHGTQLPVNMRALVVPGLGRNIFAPTAELRNGVRFVLEKKLYLTIRGTVISLKQDPRDQGMCSLDITFQRDSHGVLGKPEGVSPDSGSGVVYTATTSASVWHRRLGHMNPRNMEVLHNKKGNGVEYTGTISGCDICSVTKSKQQAHPKKSTRETTRPMQLVYTDLMGPFTPAAKGGYRFVSKFADDYLHNLEPDLTGLRAIGARAFVHRETYTKKLEDKAFEGKLCGYSHNSKAYRIYNPAKGTVVESRNVTFLETPAYTLPPDVTTEDYHCEEDVLRFTSVLDSSLLEEDLFTPNCDLSSAELEGQVQRLRQEVRRLSKINAAQPPSPSSTPASPGVAVDQRDAGTREPEPASPSTNQEPENEDEHGPPLPAAPVTGPSLRIRSDGRPFEVTRASTRRSPSSKDTEYPGALHTLFPTYDHDPRALTSSQLLHIATQTTPSMLITADSAHLDGQPFDTPRAFVYATGVPVHKGFSEEGQPVRIPNSYKDAQKSPQWGDWNDAIQKEMDSLRKHNVYKLVKMSSVPKEEKIIGSRFIFKQKVDGRFKARLVVQGYAQEAGVDYGRSYAPVCRIGSIRTVLAIACEHGWPVWQMDVVVAFLQAHIDKDVYVKPAPGHDPRDPKTGEVMVYKLERSLYGLAQSPVLWYDTIDGVLIVIGFSPTHSDPCVYVHGSGDTLIILTLYVGDILLTGKDPVLVDQKKRELKERFEMTDMGEVTRIFGMEVKRDYDQGTLAITQTDYVENLLERFEMQNANVAHTPGYGQELSSEQPEYKLLGVQGIKLYQSITGSLLYLAQCTRYDLCYAVNQLTRACNRPAEVYMAAAKHVLRYLRGTPDLPITYRKGQLRLVSYTDASFGANPDNRKSTTGYLFFLGGAPISFGSKTQSLTTQPTVESELQAFSYGAREAVYLSNFLTELRLKDSSQVLIRSDSTGALSVAGTSMFSARTKHIALRYFFVRELVKKNKITLHYTPTKQMLADIVTKHLSKHTFRDLLQQIKNFTS